jgi:flagellar P-ring protein precursor FlgI
MKRTIIQAIVVVGMMLTVGGRAGARLKDIAVVAGATDNQLTGYGLVVGIAGDGDKNPLYTRSMLANLLQHYGLSLPATTLSAKNVAAVVVTAQIPAF